MIISHNDIIQHEVECIKYDDEKIDEIKRQIINLQETINGLNNNIKKSKSKIHAELHRIKFGINPDECKHVVSDRTLSKDGTGYSGKICAKCSSLIVYRDNGRMLRIWTPKKPFEFGCTHKITLSYADTAFHVGDKYYVPLNTCGHWCPECGYSFEIDNSGKDLRIEYLEKINPKSYK